MGILWAKVNPGEGEDTTFIIVMNDKNAKLRRSITPTTNRKCKRQIKTVSVYKFINLTTILFWNDIVYVTSVASDLVGKL